MSGTSKLRSLLDRVLSTLPYSAIVVLSAALYVTGNLYLIDNKLTDVGFELSPRPATGDVVLVEIDAKSIDALKIWPWPRSYHARLVDRLLDAGARRIAFDVDFSARSRPEDDAALEDAFRRAEGRLVLPTFRQLARTAGGGLNFLESAPLPEFGRHADIATVTVRPEPDGLIRTMMVSDGEQPSLAATLADRTGKGSADFYIDFGIQLETIPRVSFVDILLGRFDPGFIAGKQVLIGSTAVELGDQLAVPLHKSIPGPLTHILGFESLAQERALYGTANLPIVIGVILISAILGPLFLRWSWQRSLLVLGVALCGLIGLKLGLQHATPALIDVSPMLLAAVLSFVFAVIRRVDQQALRLVFQSIDLRRKDVMMRNVVHNSFDGILTVSLTGQIESENPSAKAIFDSNLVGRPLSAFFPILESAEDAQSLVDALHVGDEPFEMTGRRQDGHTFPAELSVSEVDTDDQRVLTLFLRDITDRKEQERKLEYQANHDALTGLPNRKLFSERLEQTLSIAALAEDGFAVLLLDLDRFKEVNDTLGHPTGDLLLQEIAKRLQAIIPPQDLIARVGGDEFAVLLPSTETIEQAEALSGEILKSLYEPYDLAGLTLEVGGSVGIAMYPEHGQDAATLVKCADVAMYAAKKSQSGFGVYDIEADQNSVRFLTLTGDLRRAIQEGHLALYYQPKISLSKNHIVAVEALIRWIHPEHGFIPPDEFIEKAEQTGVIGEVTEWVLDTAVAKAAEWAARDCGIDMAVNLSARLLADSATVEMVEKVLRKSGLDPSSLILEVTESALMDDPGKAMEVITQLSELGTRISIDDFGTGYSSLGYLKDLPADEMKIDKCFVQSMLENESDATIVKSTVGLAHALGLKVVAEGIETEEMQDYLADIDCDVGQGYLFSKPLPIEELEFWLVSSPWGLQTDFSDLPMISSNAATY